MKNKDFEVLEIQKEVNYFSVLIKDKKEDFEFWIDCNIENDGGEYITWDFNKYIFINECKQDEREKSYRENNKNCERLANFIDIIQYNIIDKVKED